MKKHTTKSEPKCVIYGLYCTCHPEKGIRYVGQTSVGARMRLHHHTYLARNGGGYPVSRWIRKHGQENIEYEILEELEDTAEIDERESWWIEEKSTMVADGGLNLWPGGTTARGYAHPAESVMRRRGKKIHSEETRKRLAEISRGRTGLKSNRAKLSREQVEEIRYRAWMGETGREISKDLPLTSEAVSKIIAYQGYLDVPGPTGPPRPSSTGRFKSGERTRAKLTPEIVRAIRKEHGGVRGENRRLAEKYGVTPENISMVVLRRTWRDVE